MKNVLILENIHESGVDYLSRQFNIDIELGCSREKLLQIVDRYQIIIVKSVVIIDFELLEAAKNLVLIGRAGTGVDNIDTAEVAIRGITLITVPTGNSVTAAEYTIALMLSLAHRLPEAYEFVRNNDFRRHLLEGRELSNLTVGLVGLGNVGINVARRLFSFGCTVMAYDPDSGNKSEFVKLGGVLTESSKEIFLNSDVLSFHVRLNASTKKMLNRETVSDLKQSVLLINISRAGIIDDDVLLTAIEDNIISFAALDVISPEPPYDLKPDDHHYFHKLLNHPRILITPHIGASTVDAQRSISIDLAKAITTKMCTPECETQSV